MANIIDIIVTGKDNASKVLERVGQTAERAFQRAERASTQLTSRMKEIGRQGRQLGESMVDMSENMIQGLTVPLALIGAVAIKSAGDIDRMFSVLQAQTGNSEAAMKRLTPIVQQVFRDGLGKDLNEVATIAGHAQKNLWKLNDIQLSRVINSVASLSTILGIDATGAIDQVSELMTKFGITSDQAMDLVAAGVKTAALNSKNLATTLQQVKGRAEEVVAIAQDDTWTQFNSKWRELQEALEPIGKVLIELALKYLPSVIVAISNFSSWFSSLSSGAQLALVGITSFVAILPVILMSLGALIMLGSSVISFFGTIGGAIAAVTAPTWGWIAGIAALIAILVIAWNRSQAFRDVVLSAWESIKSGFQAVVDYLTPAVQAVVDFIMQQWQKIVTWWTTNGVTILQAIQNVWDFIKQIIQIAMDTIIPILQAAWNIVVTVIQTAWEIIKLVVTTAIDLILNIISLFANILTGNWSAAWENIKTIVSTVWNFIKSIISTAIRGIYNIIASVLSAIWTVIKSVWNGIVSTISLVLRTIWNIIKNIWNSIKSTISSAINRIKNYISNGFNSAKNTVSNIVNNIKNSLSGMASSAVQWGRNLISSFADGIASAGNRVIAKAKAIADTVKDYLGFSSPTKKGPGSTSDKWAPNLVNMFADGMNAGVPKIRMAATNAANATSNIQQPTNTTSTSSTSRQQPIINIYEAQRTTDKEVLNALRKAAFLYG